jgi:hypothetical protein
VCFQNQNNDINDNAWTYLKIIIKSIGIAVWSYITSVCSCLLNVNFFLLFVFWPFLSTFIVRTSNEASRLLNLRISVLRRLTIISYDILTKKITNKYPVVSYLVCFRLKSLRFQWWNHLICDKIIWKLGSKLIANFVPESIPVARNHPTKMT